MTEPPPVSSASEPGLPPHPLLAAVEAVRTALAGVRQVQPVFLDAASKTVLVGELAAARAQLAELELRVLAACGPRSPSGVPRGKGSRGWFVPVSTLAGDSDWLPG